MRIHCLGANLLWWVFLVDACCNFKCVVCAAEHTDSVEAVAFSPVMQAAVTASMDCAMLVWDNSTLALRATCQHSEVHSLSRRQRSSECRAPTRQLAVNASPLQPSMR